MNALLSSREKQKHAGGEEMTFELGFTEEGLSWTEAASGVAWGSGVSQIPVLALFFLSFPICPVGDGYTCVSGLLCGWKETLGKAFGTARALRQQVP